LVYGKEVVFPTHLGLPVMKFIQESYEKRDDPSRIINQIIELNEDRDEI